MSTVRVVNLQHPDSVEPNVVLNTDGTATFASGVTVSGFNNISVSGTAQFASGTAASPSLTFEGDSDTGIFSSGTNELAITTGGTQRLIVGNNGHVGIGTISGTPSAELTVVNGIAHIERPSDWWSSTSFYDIAGYGHIGTEGSFGIGITSNGYRDSSNNWVSQNANNNTGAAQLALNPAGYIDFFTDSNKATGSSHVLTRRMRISGLGRISTFSEDGTAMIIASNKAAGTDRILSGRNGATGIDGGTESFRVRTNGDVGNTNNTYGSLSDVKLKRNIIDSGSQWEDIKALRVRKYNFIAGQTYQQIGVIAQEIESICPGLVESDIDYDEEGNELGTVTKSVKYSVLYMKAVKALQEAITRIETLETEVATLKATS